MRKVWIHISDQLVSIIIIELLYINKQKYLKILIYYLRLGFLDNGQYIVLCATKQQLKAISELTHMEIDMAFKRINGNTGGVSIFTSCAKKYVANCIYLLVLFN
jgi:hypothetical protein